MSIKSESDIVSALADDVTQSIAYQVLDRLEDDTDVKFPEDSGLRNIWEEVCVQIQGQHSSIWPAYDETVFEYVSAAFGKRPVYQQIAVWLQTEDGMDELYDDDREPNEALSYDSGGAALSILDYLYGIASDYHNEAVDAYLAD